SLGRLGRLGRLGGLGSLGRLGRLGGLGRPGRFGRLGGLGGSGPGGGPGPGRLRGLVRAHGRARTGSGAVRTRLRQIILGHVAAAYRLTGRSTQSPAAGEVLCPGTAPDGILDPQWSRAATMEASPSLVYGAALLMRFGLTP